jgi:hypothetical protein
MNISLELIFSIIIQLVSIGIFIGMFKTSLSFMQEQIKDLKEEMHRYNSVLARLAVAENSIKSCHNRIDTLEEKL